MSPCKFLPLALNAFYCFANEETTMCLEHTISCNRFFLFSDSHSNTHPLTPLHLATRIEAAKRHWRAHWACRLTLAHPGMRLVEDHPSRLRSPGCLGQFMTPTRGDCIADTLESKWLSHRPAPLLPASIQGVFLVVYYAKRFLCCHYNCDCYALAIILSCILLLQCLFWSLLDKKTRFSHW